MKYSSVKTLILPLAILVLVLDTGILVTSCKRLRIKSFNLLRSGSTAKKSSAFPWTPSSTKSNSLPKVTYLNGAKITGSRQQWISPKSRLSFKYSPGFKDPKHKYGKTNYGYYGGNVFGNNYYGSGKLKDGIFTGAGSNEFRFLHRRGFLGGGDPSIASMEVFHHYLLFQSLLRFQRVTDNDWSNSRHNPVSGSFEKPTCYPECPQEAFCDYGICRCRQNFDAMYGHCWSDINDFLAKENEEEWETRAKQWYDPLDPMTNACFDGKQKICQDIDMNLICMEYKCTCRDRMRWNNDTKECQIYLDVNCPSLYAELITSKKLQEKSYRNQLDPGEETRLFANLTLQGSDLIRIQDPIMFSQYNVKRAFCEDVFRLSHFYDKEHDRAIRNDEVTGKWSPEHNTVAGYDVNKKQVAPGIQWGPWQVFSMIVMPVLVFLLILAVCFNMLRKESQREASRLNRYAMEDVRSQNRTNQRLENQGRAATSGSRQSDPDPSNVTPLTVSIPQYQSPVIGGTQIPIVEPQEGGLLDDIARLPVPYPDSPPPAYSDIVSPPGSPPPYPGTPTVSVTKSS